MNSVPWGKKKNRVRKVGMPVGSWCVQGGLSLPYRIEWYAEDIWRRQSWDRLKEVQELTSGIYAGGGADCVPGRGRNQRPELKLVADHSKRAETSVAGERGGVPRGKRQGRLGGRSKDFDFSWVRCSHWRDSGRGVAWFELKFYQNHLSCTVKSTL